MASPLLKSSGKSVFSFTCTWSPSQAMLAFCAAHQDKNAGGKIPISFKLSPSAAIPFAVSHCVSFAVQLSWKIAMPTGGF